MFQEMMQLAIIIIVLLQNRALVDGWVQGWDRQLKRRMTIVLVYLLLKSGMGELAANQQAAEASHISNSIVRKR